MSEATTKLPFWIHQIVEYGIGALLAYQAIHSPKPIVPLVAGLIVVALAATADGPAACFSVVSRPFHRVLDLVVAAGLLLSALLFGNAMGGAGQIILVLGALALGGADLAFGLPHQGVAEGPSGGHPPGDAGRLGEGRGARPQRRSHRRSRHEGVPQAPLALRR